MINVTVPLSALTLNGDSLNVTSASLKLHDKAAALEAATRFADAFFFLLRALPISLPSSSSMFSIWVAVVERVYGAQSEFSYT